MRRVVQVIVADNVDLTALCLKNLFQLDICVNKQDCIFMPKVTITMSKTEQEMYDHMAEVSINSYLET